MSSKAAVLASFVEAAPPGEVDIKSLTSNGSDVIESLGPAFQKYNEIQLTTVKLPGSSGVVLVSEFNALGDGRYFDPGSQSLFIFDHATQKASEVLSYTLESEHSDLIKSLQRIFSTYASEHYASSTFGIYPAESTSSIALVLVANKYSPSNYWNGRWRSVYTYSPSSGSLTGNIKVDVHYYEDGNVRLLTTKPVEAKLGSGASAQDVVKQIGMAEQRYQEELNRGFAALSEGAFKGLRRQLPVTRQKVEWEKIGGYRLGQDIGGGRSR
ncbi:F-actin-capping protein subunit alpha [Elasticomyces elasticus]|nr:F-actin-capping protein subunit alpha [Elasticomyces elasticus]